MKVRRISWGYASTLGILYFIINFIKSSSALNEAIISKNRSPLHLIELADMDAKIFETLSANANSKSLRKLELVKKYFADYEDSTLESTKGLRNTEASLVVSKNPILCFRMIRRYFKILRPLLQEMTEFKATNSQLRSLMKTLERRRLQKRWLPSEVDFQDALSAMTRLHITYTFDLKKFVSGNILGVHTIATLRPIHCREIGEFALTSKKFVSAILWFEVGLKISPKDPKLRKSLVKAKDVHDDLWANGRANNLNFFTEKLSHMKNVEERKWMLEFPPEEGRGKPWYYGTVRFRELCSGKNFQTKEEVSKLFCWYETKSNPAWTINPLKVEQLSISPHLVQFYDVLTQKTMAMLKNERNVNLKRSAVHGRIVSHSRTSVQAWSDGKWENVASLDYFVGLITGLKTTFPESSERYQVVAYTFGGHYSPHMDVGVVNFRQMGERLATFMFYLEDVEIGGLTAFPHIGVASKPIKGSAVLWYNLFKKGGPDRRTTHGACPVVLGHKWIATKWIKVDDQFLRRPCGLNPDE